MSKFFNGKIPLNDREKGGWTLSPIPSDQSGTLNEKIELCTQILSKHTHTQPLYHLHIATHTVSHYITLQLMLGVQRSCRRCKVIPNHPKCLHSTGESAVRQRLLRSFIIFISFFYIVEPVWMFANLLFHVVFSLAWLLFYWTTCLSIVLIFASCVSRWWLITRLLSVRYSKQRSSCWVFLPGSALQLIVVHAFFCCTKPLGHGFKEDE